MGSVTLVLLVVVIGSTASQMIQYGRRPSCEHVVCPAIYQPICSWEGNTHDNHCLLQCSGDSMKCNGKCPCRYGFAPPVMYGMPPYVGQLMFGYHRYPNDGYRRPAYECRCAKDLDQVCGVDGEQYDNACNAYCERVAIACEGRCPCTV